MSTLLTTRDLAKHLGVERATVRSWVKRYGLQRRGLTKEGWPLYDQVEAARIERATAQRAGRI